jgi:hypothetical protein
VGMTLFPEKAYRVANRIRGEILYYDKRMFLMKGMYATQDATVHCEYWAE